MNKIVITAFITMFFSLNVFAGELFDGLTLSSAQSAQGGVKNYSLGLNGLVSMRPTSYFGTDFQLGAFGQSGQFDYSVWLDGTAVAYLPLGKGGFSLYGKAGLAIIYLFESNNPANTLTPTYGTGIEFKGKKSVVRLGIQHYNVGSVSDSQSLSTNLAGISLLRIVE